MRVDERDIMFSRMGYAEGSDEYEDYYSRNPDKKDIDDELRAMEDLCSPKSPTYDPISAPAVNANFEFLHGIKHLCDGKPAEEKIDTNPEEISRVIKNMCLHYGAAEVGITELKDDYLYSHRGRHPENYGEEITTDHKYAIVFAVRMKPEIINTAPMMFSAMESSKAYVDGAIIGMQILYYLNSLGYDARNHMDGNYLLQARPIAQAAGIGNIGRNTLLMTDEYGCFVRLGVVTTELPLVCDRPMEQDISEFCKLCNRCSVTCPAKTIDTSDNPENWNIEQEKCYKIWRALGTDCGVCISSCPVGQGITISEIAKMTKEQKQEFLDDYSAKYGARNYTRKSPL